MGDAALFVREVGRGRPLVVLHGGPDFDHRYLLPDMDRLADAFRLIFERYSRPVISFIYDMVNDRGLAEELTQETFVRAYRAIHTMRAETKLSTWLFGIARNVARESLRNSMRDARHTELDDKGVLAICDERPTPAGQHGTHHIAA